MPDRRTPLHPPLELQELCSESIGYLPDRHALSTITLTFRFPVDNFAMPVNEATSINYEATHSTAVADASQVVIINQSDMH